MADEEDVALSVMKSFFEAARAGRFPELHDSDGIWRLLCCMTRRKVIDYIRRTAARPVQGESVFGSSPDMRSIASNDPTPAMNAMIRDQIERMLTALPEKYHLIALKKLECMTVPEIAQHCGVHISTVERRLRIIRAFWAKEMGDADE
jgi:RNA polymerase sigma factor (sigma-70 family)